MMKNDHVLQVNFPILVSLSLVNFIRTCCFLNVSFIPAYTHL